MRRLTLAFGLLDVGNVYISFRQTRVLISFHSGTTRSHMSEYGWEEHRAVGEFTEGPFLTYTRVCLLADMADLQMKLLRKKIQKRNEKNKERKFRQKRREEEEETGKVCRLI